MLKNYFILFLLAHIIGDFYFQTEHIAKMKIKSLKWTMIHSLIYFGSMLLITSPIMNFEIALGVSIASILHCIIDIVKYKVIKKDKGINNEIRDKNIFIIDQILHLVILFVVSFSFVKLKVMPNANYIFKELLDVIDVSEVKIIYLLCALLLIHKPANITISKLIKQFKPKDEEDQQKNAQAVNALKAGGFIGTLERIIMLIFLYLNQYSAIGLVLTAKSIARYEKIAKEKDFAEYYLLGTLLSTLVAIIASFIFS